MCLNQMGNFNKFKHLIWKVHFFLSLKLIDCGQLWYLCTWKKVCLNSLKQLFCIIYSITCMWYAAYNVYICIHTATLTDISIYFNHNNLMSHSHMNVSPVIRAFVYIVCVYTRCECMYSSAPNAYARNIIWLPQTHMSVYTRTLEYISK